MLLYEMYASFKIQITAAKWKMFAYVPCISVIGKWSRSKKNIENNKGFESISWQAEMKLWAKAVE